MRARVTSKGQVTVPARVRSALGVETGDDLVFDIRADGSAEVRVVKRSRLTDLYGALPAGRAYPGKQRVRQEVAVERSRHYEGR